MARVLQLRRGTTAENDLFTGAIGELTMDTTTNELRIHDGSTVGGTIVASDKVTKGHELIDYQAPTSANNYTWYRKYADGWVEQGGIVFPATTIPTRRSVSLPVEMSGTTYSVLVTPGDDAADPGVYSYYTNRSSTGFELLYSHTSSSYTIGDVWQVSGIAA